MYDVTNHMRGNLHSSASLIGGSLVVHRANHQVTGLIGNQVHPMRHLTNSPNLDGLVTLVYLLKMPGDGGGKLFGRSCLAWGSVGVSVDRH